MKITRQRKDIRSGTRLSDPTISSSCEVECYGIRWRIIVTGSKFHTRYQVVPWDAPKTIVLSGMSHSFSDAYVKAFGELDCENGKQLILAALQGI
jgi:hypothetical protein